MKQDLKKNENISEQIEQLKKEVEEYKNKYLRALADYQNFEKRVREEKDEVRNQFNKELLLRLLTFLDNLDKAEIFIKDNNLKMIKDNFYKILKDEGLKEIDILGKEFNPYTSEVVDIIEGKQDNIVVEVLRKGYEFKRKMIRVAQVKVSKKKVDEKAEEKANND